MRPRAVLAACALCIAAVPLGARASGSVDVSGSMSSLSSPSGSYGPWVYEDLNVQLPPGANVGLHLENRHASGRYNPNTEQLLGIDAYLPLSHAATLYTGAWFGSGAPYLRDRFTAELDLKTGGHFVPFAGGSLGSGYGIGTVRQVYAGAYYYFGDDYASVRYAPSWSSVLGSTQGYQFTLSVGHPGRTTETLRAGTGGEYDISLVTPANPTLIGEREFDSSLSVKHWTSASSGFHVDVDYGTLYRTGGAQIYTRAGFGGGVFFALP